MPLYVLNVASVRTFNMGACQNTDFIFVYGTLRASERHPLAQLLARNARFMGEASYQGRLYRVKDYPGAVPSDDPTENVQGDVFFLTNKKKLLPQLDRYEACSPNFPKPTEFIRTIQKVCFRDGRTVSAWIYLYNYSTAGLAMIESGNYAAGLLTKKVNRHQPFKPRRSLYQPHRKKRPRTQ